MICDLEGFDCSVRVHDPLVFEDKGADTGGVNLIKSPNKNSYNAVVLAVPHKEFLKFGIDKIRRYGKADHIFFDLKSVFLKEQSDGRL